MEIKDNEPQLQPTNNAERMPMTPNPLLKNQRGNFLLITGVIVILIIGSFVAFTLLKNNSQPDKNYSNNISPSPTTTSTISSSPSPITNNTVVPLSNAWSQLSTFANSKLDISFDYPSYFEVKEVDIAKENKEWADKYKNDTNVRQPLYSSSFAARFFTPEVNIEAVNNLPAGVENYRFVCDNKMSIYVARYENNEGLSLYDYIAKLNKTYPGDGVTENFETYKKYLTQTSIPQPGSYVFKGIIGENPVKEVYFINKGKVYEFHLSGNCDTGGEYTQEAEKIFENVLRSVKFL